MKSHTDGSLPVDAPLTLDTPDAVPWAQSCEVLVVGFGAAGAAAAITAKEAGADVQIVDRFGMGGATAKSGGVIYAGGGTAQQKKLGFNDTPEAMFNYLRLETGDAVSEQTLRHFCEDSRGMVTWLESMGASFDSDAPPPKTSYPPDGTYLYYSGNEKVMPFSAAATPAPRGHRTVDHGLSGRKLFSHLRDKVESLGIPLMPQAGVRRLITDKTTGEVLGAEVWRMPPGTHVAKRHWRLIRWADTIHNVAPGPADRLRRKAKTLELAHAEPMNIRATHGLLLTTGGFIFNREMLADNAPKYNGNMRIGTTGCDGSGIRLAQTVGADVARMDKVSAWRFINPPQAWAKGVVVDAKGERFCNEAAYGARLGVAMCEDHDGKAWLIIDAALRRVAWRECWRDNLWSFQKYPAMLLMLFARRSTTLARLAKRLKLPVEPFCASIHRYNNAASQQNEDTFEKSTGSMQPLLKPPYSAINISVSNPLFPCPAITLGGLRVDEDSSAVLNTDGKPIPGLYAAGRAAVGIASNGYVSGLSLADCLWSGRRAGAAITNVQKNTAEAQTKTA